MLINAPASKTDSVCVPSTQYLAPNMSNTVIKVENLSKLYRLGEVGTGTLSHDLNRWFAKIRGKVDPFAKVAGERPH
jgi:hypothetical protein